MLQYSLRSHARALLTSARPRACLAPTPTPDSIIARSSSLLHHQYRYYVGPISPENRNAVVRNAGNTVAIKASAELRYTPDALAEELAATGIWGESRKGLPPVKIPKKKREVKPPKIKQKHGRPRVRPLGPHPRKKMGRPRKHPLPDGDTASSETVMDAADETAAMDKAVDAVAKKTKKSASTDSTVEPAKKTTKKAKGKAVEDATTETVAKKATNKPKKTKVIDTVVEPGKKRKTAKPPTPPVPVGDAGSPETVMEEVEEISVIDTAVEPKKGTKKRKVERPETPPLPLEDTAIESEDTRLESSEKPPYPAEETTVKTEETTTAKSPRKPLVDAARNSKQKPDKTRVNITSQNLVDDTIEYLKPSLERHKGCDLISIYPGAGLWTKALHDAVQPRSHLLLEPEPQTYQRFLQPLLDQDGVRLVPKSGLIWDDVDAVLTPEYLPHQVAFDRSDPKGPPRNDTLLVNMHLVFFPKKRYQKFTSISRMVIYQLIHSLRSSGIFQKYGQVRMLIWFPDDEKRQVLPRVLHERKRLAMEAELSTEYISEVCGYDPPHISDVVTRGQKTAGPETRWQTMDLESARLVHHRMQKLGMKTPPGRETVWQRELMKCDPEMLKQPIPMWKPFGDESTHFRGQAQYLQLAAEHDKTPFVKNSAEWKRYDLARKQVEYNRMCYHTAVAWRPMHDAVVAAYQLASKARTPGRSRRRLRHAQALEKAFDEYNSKLSRQVIMNSKHTRDGMHMLRNQPAHLGPVLAWDRRLYEPLTVQPHDFFPNVPCALLDIQPKATHPLLRSSGPGSDNAAEIFDLIFTSLAEQITAPLSNGLAAVWPGVREDVVPLCKSLLDPARGGIPLMGKYGLPARAANEEQLMEVLEKFMAWPFRPTYAEMVGRLTSDDDDPDEEDPVFNPRR